MRISDWSSDVCSSDLFLGELGCTRGAHLLKILTGMIAGAGERTRRHLKETLGSRDSCISAEGLRRHEINHLGMARRRLKILAHSEEIDVCRTHNVHHLMHFQPLLAQTKHDA